MSEVPPFRLTCVACGDVTLCGHPAGLELTAPCTACGATQKQLELTVHDHSPGFMDYWKVRAEPAVRDPTLPEKGVVRWEAGRRVGRDGRTVDRTARYDPWHDVAEERVVDVESGEALVDKRESMAAKYAARGRFKPPTDAKPAPAWIRRAMMRLLGR